MSELKNCPSPELLEKLLDGLVSAEQEKAITRHLDGCPKCRDVLDGLGSLASIQGQDSKLHLSPEANDSQLFKSRLEKIRSSPPDASPSLNAGYTDVLPWLEPSESGIGRIAEFTLVRFIGRGGMGLVFEAFDEKLQRKVAIKLMSPGLLADSNASERFLREARSAAQINHVNVVTIHGVDQIRGLPWLVMELIDGRSLDDQMKLSGQLPTKEILKIARQTALGLQAAHNCGITHRDIKPSNLMLDRNSKRIKIADFGLASSLNETSFTRSGMLVGTPDFASPEQVNSQPVDARSDLFSLGSVLYLLCTDALPFSHDSLLGTLDAVRNSELQPANLINENIPSGLAKIVQRLMEKNPNDRFQSADELLAAIETVSKKRAPKHSANAADPAKGNETAWLWPVLVAIAGVGLLATVGTAWINWPQGSPDQVAKVAPVEKEIDESIEPDSTKAKEAKPQEVSADKVNESTSDAQEEATPVILDPTRKEDAAVATAREHTAESSEIASTPEDAKTVELESKSPKSVETIEQLRASLQAKGDVTIRLLSGRTYRLQRPIQIEDRKVVFEGDEDDRPRIEIADGYEGPIFLVENSTLEFNGVEVATDLDFESEELCIKCMSSELIVKDSIVQLESEGVAIELSDSELSVQDSLLIASNFLFGIEPSDSQKLGVLNSVLISTTNFQIGGATSLYFVARNSQFLNQLTFVIFEDDFEDLSVAIAAEHCTFGSKQAMFGFEAESSRSSGSVSREFAEKLDWDSIDCVIPKALLHSEYRGRRSNLLWRNADVELDSDSRIAQVEAGVIDDLIEEIEEDRSRSVAAVKALIEREID